MSKKSRKTKLPTRKASTPLPTTSTPAIVEQDAKQENAETFFAVVPVSGTTIQLETSPNSRGEALSSRKVRPPVGLNYHLEKRKVIVQDLEPAAKLLEPIASTQESRDLHADWSGDDVCTVSGEFFRIPVDSAEGPIDLEDFDMAATREEDPPEIRRRRSRFRMVIGTLLVGAAALLIVGVARSSQSTRIQGNGKTTTCVTETRSSAAVLGDESLSVR